MINDVYSQCPTCQGNIITLRQTVLTDAAELLNCYADEKVVPFFNSDNCHGDDFHYQTLERMQQAIEFWDSSYRKRHFVRWSVIDNRTHSIFGTVEMFHRRAADEFDHYGVLRIDLRSDYEQQEYLNAILAIVNTHFYTDFEVEHILTKAIPAAVERIAALQNHGYVPLNRKLMVYDDYFVREYES
ncbi:MAG TPA: GNAT family N-acetyltransferase [Bacillota bacterium]|nr:GNAT family N-acetyltransferase [Bacillota bacterium]